MMILLTNGNPLGLRPVGSGGRTAAASYEQITRTLRQAFGPDHAALFAEPSRRTGSIDWFAQGEPDTVPLRLVDAPPDRLDPALDRLERLVRDIGTKAAALQKSDRQDERILGEMLAQSLDIPDEGAAFLVGEQPVLTFWGHVKDRDRPAVNPIDALLRRRSGLRIIPPDDAGVAALTAARGGSSGRLLPVALWAILVLLLAVCAVQLVRSCVLRLPHGLTGWIGDSCTASGSDGTQAGLDDETARQAALQAQFEDLTRQAGLKRQACLANPGQNTPPATGPVSLPPATPTPGPATPPGPVVASKTDTPPDAPQPPSTGTPSAPVQASKTDTPPNTTQPPAKPGTTPGGADKPKSDTPPAPVATQKTDTPPDATQPPAKTDAPADKLKIPPDKTKGVAFLEGCWRAHEGLTENHDGKQTGKVLKVTYCFGSDGTGARTIRYLEDGGRCVGPIKANLDGETLTMEIGASPCDAPHGRFDPATDRCKRSGDGTAHCDEVQTDGKTTNFSDFPFTRTGEQP